MFVRLKLMIFLRCAGSNPSKGMVVAERKNCLVARPTFIFAVVLGEKRKKCLDMISSRIASLEGGLQEPEEPRKRFQAVYRGERVVSIALKSLESGFKDCKWSFRRCEDVKGCLEEFEWCDKCEE